MVVGGFGCNAAALSSPFEHQAGVLIADGNANKQAGEKLGISIKTVEKHRQSMMNKLHIHEAAGLARYAIAQRVVPCDRPSLVPTDIASDALNLTAALQSGV